ncbi:hypothetical protein D3C80_1916890 [compost metagenome]
MAKSALFGSCKKSESPSITPPKLTGIYNINENRSAVSCFIPTATAEIMVAPERLIPGVKATACPSPTMKASLMVILPSSFLPFRLRINHNAIPVTKSITAIVVMLTFSAI